MSDTAGAPLAPSKAKVFLRRLITTVILWTVILTALFSRYQLFSQGVFLFIIVFLAVTGLLEFYGLAAKRGLPCFRWCGLIGGVLLMVGTFFNVTGHIGTSGTPSRVNDFETGFLIIFVLGLCLRQFLSIQFFPGIDGKYFLLYFVLVTKFSDMGAYLLGSLIGKHKMIPRISPGKTWEGFAGAILASTGGSVVFVHFLGQHMVGMNIYHAVVLGILLSICAVIGDLIESLFKRECGMKDSGTLFPGIGGILDLLDSLLFNAPIMYLYLRHVLIQ